MDNQLKNVIALASNIAEAHVRCGKTEVFDLASQGVCKREPPDAEVLAKLSEIVDMMTFDKEGNCKTFKRP